MRRIGVLTSGVDAPGMNAAIRAVTRTALEIGWEVYGVRRGYSGLVAGDSSLLGARDVGGIMQYGGTVLGSARCPEFKTDEGRSRALASLGNAGIEALAIIGGNGSQAGANVLSRAGFPVVGVASGGGSGWGRSGKTLYHCLGISLSGKRILQSMGSPSLR